MLSKFNAVVFDLLGKNIKYYYNNLDYKFYYYLFSILKCFYFFFIQFSICLGVLILSFLNKSILFKKELMYNVEVVFNIFLKFLFIKKLNYLYIFSFSLYLNLLNNTKKQNKNYLNYDSFIALPSKYKIFTLLKSPHIHKKARDQFFLVTNRIYFALKYFVTFYPKLFYLNFISSISITLNRKMHYIY